MGFFMQEDLKNKLYQFVMEATLLKTLQDDYRDSKTELDMASHQIMEKQRHLDEHNEDLKELTEKFNNYNKFCNNDRFGDNKTREMVKWGFATQCKEKYLTISKNYEKLTTEKDELEKSKMSCVGQMIACEDKLKETEFMNNNLKDSVLRFEDELKKYNTKKKELGFRMNDLEAEFKDTLAEKEGLKLRIQEMSNKLSIAKKSRFHSQLEETEFN